MWGKQDRNKLCRGWGTAHWSSPPRESRLKKLNLLEVREKLRLAEVSQESETLLKNQKKKNLCWVTEFSNLAV